MSNHHVSIKNFTMRFGDKVVVDGLTFNVKRGEVFGFLGDNGSGKTTTLRALLGIYEPTAGTLHIDGRRYSSGLGATLGYLPEERGLYKKETVIDTMIYFGVLKGMRRHEAEAWSRKYLAEVGLGGKANLKLDKLSGGQQQKVQLGVTIMNDPELLILDEPTKGLDPVNRRLLMELIERQNKQGTTIMLVTHQMEVVERLCDRIIMLKDGKRAAYGETDEVRSQFGDDVIIVRFNGHLETATRLFSIRAQQAHSAELLPNPGISPQKILAFLLKNGLEIHLFEVKKPSLEDVFVTIYGEPDDEETGRARHA